MTASKRSDRNIATVMARALELTEQALSEVARIAIEEIHSGLESSNHVQAAERDMRNALRQLVMAERDLRSKSGMRTDAHPQPGSIADAHPGSGSDRQ
jgi:prophage DNA circulation protein